MKEELNRIIEGNVLDMDFEDEVASAVLEAHGEALYKADEETLQGDNENLKRLAKILYVLAECVEKAKQDNGIPVFFEFFIPRHWSNRLGIITRIKVRSIHSFSPPPWTIA